MISNAQKTSELITEEAALETETPEATPILNIAWERFAQLSAVSRRRSHAFRRLRIWIALLGILATLFALLTDAFSRATPSVAGSIAGFVIKIFFISVPIIASLLAAFGTRAFSNGDWLIARAAAEEYLKEIYLYRTILQKKKSR